MKHIFAFAIFGLILMLNIYAQPKRFTINDAILSSLKSAEVAENFDVSVKKCRPFALNPVIRNYNNVTIGDTLQLALFPEKEYLSVIQSKTTDVNGTTVLVAKIIGFQFAWCFISISDQSVLVTVDIPERKEKYTTRFQSQKSTQYLVQLDENKLDILEDSQVLIPDNDVLGMSNLPKEKERNILIEKNALQDNIDLSSAQVSPGVNDSAQIDILVVYTPAAKEWADTYEGGINNTISLAMANCNLVSENSKLGIKFNLVYSTEVDYTETGDSHIDVENLKDGTISNVFAMRDAVAADLVILITKTTDFSGIAWPMLDKNGNEECGYLISRVQELSGLTTMHEIGHTLGANHPIDQNYQPGPTVWSDWPENTWSAGWHWRGDDNIDYCDVMSYESGWYFSDGLPHTMIPYFSDPDFIFRGQPTGHATKANNARTVRETKHVVASYRMTNPKNTPTVYTFLANDITENSCISGGCVINKGGSPVSARGVVWSTSRMPTLSDHYTVDGLGSGPFNSHLSGLEANNVYYIRAYATNSVGTSYGNQVFYLHTGGEQHDFITRWQLPEGQDKLQFLLDRSGDVTYKWETVPIGQSGSGTFQSGYGLVSIPNLPMGQSIRVKIEPRNLKRFYNFKLICPDPAILSPDRENLIDVEQWGAVNWSNMKNAFYECKNLNISATDIPSLNYVKDMSSMFYYCNNLNSPVNINKWVVSSATSMKWMFLHASTFNQDIGNWDVSSVKDMSCMFMETDAFNKNIGNWNVSSVENMTTMFQEAIAFNQEIGKWNVSRVKLMLAMFQNAKKFNQYIGDWNMANVSNIYGMFCGAENFNQDIGEWDVSKVTNMSALFSKAYAFNQNIGKWNVSNVTDMGLMFSSASSFNQDVGLWDVSKVTDMWAMFNETNSFNQDIGKWNVSNVTNMNRMFFKGISFNQNIGQWNLANITNMANMLDNSGMDCYNYSATLSGWSTNTNTPDNLSIGVLGLGFGNNAKDARTKLTINKKWTITGDAATGATCDIKTNVIGNNVYNSRLKVYPNPVTNELTIEIEGNSCETEIEIIDAIGQTVYNGTIENRTTIQTGSFAPGVYLIRFGNNKILEFKKIIKK